MPILGYIRGDPLRVSDKDEFAQGGEAVIWKVPPGYRQLAKQYKLPDHIEYQGNPDAQEVVRQKLAILQTKLRDFPKGLPKEVVLPEEFFTNRNGSQIQGYLMKFLENAIPFWNFSQTDFRERGGIGHNSVVTLTRKVHSLFKGVHGAGAVIGDANSQNILIVGDEAYYVDADSMQWGKYITALYTLTYVDPILCVWNDAAGVPELHRPHNPNSDWYAFTVMFMENMLFTGPYNGNYRPKERAKRMPLYMRPLKRVTVWNPEVLYPKFALPLKVLPDDLHEYLMDVFHKDARGEFPLRLLDNLNWTKCTNCGTIHARGVCPECAMAAPAAIKQKVVIRGRVTATRIFPTSRESGTVLHASTQGTAFRFLYHDGTSLKREDGSIISRSPLDNRIRYRVRGNATLFARSGRLVVADPLISTPEVLPVDSFVDLPMFDANERNHFWLFGGSLYKNGVIGPQFIGNVLEGRTLFWVGSRFGFGFWRAGEITTGFVFETNRSGINDSVALSPIRGQLINSTATFSGDMVWFFVTYQLGAKTINRCEVIKSDGTVIATAEAVNGDDSWLGTITGKTAIGGFLLGATDDGIVRVEPQGGSIVVTREFPDTDQFVHAGSYLYPHAQGLVALTGKEIFILTIS